MSGPISFDDLVADLSDEQRAELERRNRVCANTLGAYLKQYPGNRAARRKAEALDRKGSKQ